MPVLAPPPVTPPSPDELEALIREARARQRRRWMIAAAAVAAVTGAAFAAYSVANASSRGTAGPRVSSSRPSAPAMCTAGQLAISFVHKGAVMGEEGGLLRFTNTGRTTCSVSGWPTVVAVTGAGRRVRARRIIRAPMLFATFWLHGPRVPTLALRRGRSGYSILGGFDNPVGRPPRWRCPSARRVLVSPPGNRHYVGLSGLLWPSGDYSVYLPLCGGRPFVSPVRPGPPLSQ
jgi:uncharacterized protein DUF4232